MNTTLNKIKEHRPCEDGWKNLLSYLGKTEADDEPLAIRTILESNGLDDAIWALRAVDGHEREIRLFASDCAESVLHIFEEKYPNDDRPRKAIEVARRFAKGEVGEDKLKNASAAAWSAASDAAWAAARDAAWSAASAAASDAAWDAARDAEREKQRQILLKYI